MSEYWVSKKKYFCKYCEIYIADDAPSRQQHENGLRHKGSVERFIRGLYKGSERRKKDQDEEKREMARVEQAAQAAYNQDVAAGLAKPGAGPTPSSSSAAATRKPQPKASNPYANYSTAASLGYNDPDAERLATEAERRRTQGVAGDWEVVTTIAPAALQAEEELEDQSGEIPLKLENEESHHVGVKREAEVPPDGDDARQFKLRKKTWGAGSGEVYDPTAVPIKLKAKKEEQISETAATPEEARSAAPDASTSSTPVATDVPKWKKVQWKRPGEDSMRVTQDFQATNDGVKVETEERPAKLEECQIPPLLPPQVRETTTAKALGVPPHEEEASVVVKTEDVSPPKEQKPAELKLEDAPPLTGMFRKRKITTVPRRGRN